MNFYFLNFRSDKLDNPHDLLQMSQHKASYSKSKTGHYIKKFESDVFQQDYLIDMIKRPIGLKIQNLGARVIFQSFNKAVQIIRNGVLDEEKEITIDIENDILRNNDIIKIFKDVFGNELKEIKTYDFPSIGKAISTLLEKFNYKTRSIRLNKVIKVKNPDFSASFKLRLESNKAGHFEALNQMRREKALTDFDLKVGEETFACHSIVLAARSPVFKKMLESQMLENSSRTLAITHSTPTAVRHFLDFIYLGYIVIEGDSKQEIFSSWREILLLCHQYEIADFVNICVRACKPLLEVNENLIEVYTLAKFLNNMPLRSVCRELITNDPEAGEELKKLDAEISNQEEYLKMEPEDQEKIQETLQELLKLV